MKPVTKMIWLLAIIILAAGLCFVLLDDDDTKDSPMNSGAPAQTTK